MITLAWGTPIALINSVQAMAAAPAPLTTTLMSLSAIGQVAGVDQAGGGDDRGTMLVVMEHRNVHPFLQRGLDDEAFGRGDIFEVDPAEARPEQFDALDEALGIFGIDFEIDRVDVGEALEQHGFAFHHRLRRECA